MKLDVKCRILRGLIDSAQSHGLATPSFEGLIPFAILEDRVPFSLELLRMDMLGQWLYEAVDPRIMELDEIHVDDDGVDGYEKRGLKQAAKRLSTARSFLHVGCSPDDGIAHEAIIAYESVAGTGFLRKKSDSLVDLFRRMIRLNEMTDEELERLLVEKQKELESSL